MTKDDILASYLPNNAANLETLDTAIEAAQQDIESIVGMASALQEQVGEEMLAAISHLTSMYDFDAWSIWVESHIEQEASHYGKYL